MPKEQRERGCAPIASRQFGLITLAQARENGLSADAVHDRVSAGRWERVLPGVYRVAGAPASWHQLLLCATLWAPEAAVSHEAAAALWELEDFTPGPVVLSTSSGRKARVSWVTVHRVSRLGRSDTRMIGPIRVTEPTRTIADLCTAFDRSLVEPALDDALRRGLSSLPRLRWTAERLGGQGRSGSRFLAELLRERGRGWTLQPAGSSRGCEGS